MGLFLCMYTISGSVQPAGRYALFLLVCIVQRGSLALFQAAHRFLGIFDEVEQACRVARIVPCQLIGAEGQRGRLKAVERAVLPG